jgi:hypothetical protein
VTFKTKKGHQKKNMQQREKLFFTFQLIFDNNNNVQDLYSTSQHRRRLLKRYSPKTLLNIQVLSQFWKAPVSILSNVVAGHNYVHSVVAAA